MRIKETKVYKFDELSDEAKEKAREWYREGALDYDWFEFVFDDTVKIAEILGIEISTHGVPLMNKTVKQKPSIWFSGFCSQGDGACFEGRYAYSRNWRKKLKAEAPQDPCLVSIGEDLQRAQKLARWSLTARVWHTGYYYHYNSVSIAVESELEVKEMRAAEELVEEALRKFCRWIYRRLEEEYEYLMSDEVIDESIEANEYEFEADGSLA